MILRQDLNFRTTCLITSCNRPTNIIKFLFQVRGNFVTILQLANTIKATPKSRNHSQTMFAEIWKIANKMAASNYIGPTLESVHDMESSDFVTFVNRHDVLESAKTIVIHLLKSDAHERVHVNTQRQTINIKVLMGAYLVVVFPVHGDNESSCGRSYNDRVQYLAEPAKVSLSHFRSYFS